MTGNIGKKHRTNNKGNDFEASEEILPRKKLRRQKRKLSTVSDRTIEDDTTLTSNEAQFNTEEQSSAVAPIEGDDTSQVKSDAIDASAPEQSSNKSISNLIINKAKIFGETYLKKIIQDPTKLFKDITSIRKAIIYISSASIFTSYLKPIYRSKASPIKHNTEVSESSSDIKKYNDSINEKNIITEPPNTGLSLSNKNDLSINSLKNTYQEPYKNNDTLWQSKISSLPSNNILPINNNYALQRKVDITTAPTFHDNFSKPAGLVLAALFAKKFFRHGKSQADKVEKSRLNKDDGHSLG